MPQLQRTRGWSTKIQGTFPNEVYVYELTCIENQIQIQIQSYCAILLKEGKLSKHATRTNFSFLLQQHTVKALSNTPIP